MPVIQISRIQHRMGTSGELPDALEDGEIGFTTDTGEVFIGASSLEKVADRVSYPYQNIKILTEFDVQHTITGDMYYHGPIETLDIPDNGTTATINLFTKNIAATAQFGRYDYSLTSSLGAQVGEIDLILFGSTLTRSVTATNIGDCDDTEFTITPLLTGDVVQLQFSWDPGTFGEQSFRLHISGREWSATAPS